MDYKKKKRGQFSLLINGAISVGIIAIVLGIVAQILATIQTNQTAQSQAYNATGNGLLAIGTFSGFQVTIATVVVGVAVLYFLMRGLGGLAGGARTGGGM
jgi:hypothetical protein